ncbi:MAG: tyrosine-type recombinase/integrase [Solirubrobacteraceae bacterium]
MTLLAPTLEAFFVQRLLAQKNVSPHTIASYRDCFRLLLAFVHAQTGTTPSQLRIEDLDAPMILAFLDHLERDRGVALSTRNTRLAAIHSMFRFAAFRHPEHAALIQRVMVIPNKRRPRPLVCFLTPPEVDAILASPDRSTWIGRRDHALLLIAVQTGLRVSEITGLRRQDVHLDPCAHLRCRGKGRKERATPLTRLGMQVLRAFLAERGGEPHQPVFPGPTGAPLSRDAVRRLVTRHVAAAVEHCRSLSEKTVSPHTLRHSCAMRLLEAGTDIATIALFLGHEQISSTNVYLHAHLALKEQALARTTPPGTSAKRYKPTDTLMAFLQAL